MVSMRPSGLAAFLMLVASVAAGAQVGSGGSAGGGAGTGAGTGRARGNVLGGTVTPRTVGASFGVTAMECTQCTVHLGSNVPWVEFGTEPIVRTVRRDDDPIRPGDVLVAVDGILITTPAGAQRLASLDVGKSTRFTVRRDGRQLDLAIMPTTPGWELHFTMGERGRLGWQLGTFGFNGRPVYVPTQPDARPTAGGDTIQAGRAAGTGAGRGQGIGVDSGLRMNGHITFADTLRNQQRRAIDRFTFTASDIHTGAGGWLGFGIECRSCSISTDSTGARVWDFGAYPSIVAVDKGGPAEHAGVQVGDVIRSIDGLTLTAAIQSNRFSRLRPGNKVRLGLERQGKHLDVTVTVAKVH